MAIFVVFVGIIVSAIYGFKVWADRIEGDSEGMVDPGSREPYGTTIWSIVSRDR